MNPYENTSNWTLFWRKLDMSRILDEQIEYLQSVSKEEFEIMIKLGLAAKEFQIKNIRKNSQVPNDWVFDVYRIEKKGIIQKEKSLRYVVYVDRNANQYDMNWVTNFVQNNGINLNNVEKIFVMNLNKIPKVSLEKDSSYEKKFKFLFQKNFMPFLFRRAKKDTMHLLESLYPSENSIWNNKTEERQRIFCNSLGIKFVKHMPLWRYQFGDQAKLILNLNTRKEEDHKQDYRNESHETEKLKMDYYEILAVGKNATTEDIQKSYRKLALLYHPDKSKTSGTMMIHISEAYGVLSDFNKRKKYDEMMSFC